MSDETIRTICWAVVFGFGIQAASIYCVVRLAMTGHGIFERRQPEREPMRTIHDAENRFGAAR